MDKETKRLISQTKVAAQNRIMDKQVKVYVVQKDLYELWYLLGSVVDAVFSLKSDAEAYCKLESGSTLPDSTGSYKKEEMIENPLISDPIQRNESKTNHSTYWMIIEKSLL